MAILDEEVAGVPVRESLRWGLTGLGIGLVVSLAMTLYGEASQVPWSTFKRLGWIHVPLITLSVCFVSMKSLALHYSTNKTASAWASAKLFILSTFNSITTFTGKLGADMTKWIEWKQEWHKKMHNLLRFRITGSAAAILVWGASYRPGLLTALAIITCIIAVTTILLKPEAHLSSVRATAFHTLSYTAMIAQGYILFSYLGVTDPLLPFYLSTSFFLGIISLLPFGVGVREVSMTYFLQSMLTPETIIFALIILRIESEILTSMVGAGIAAQEYIL